MKRWLGIGLLVVLVGAGWVWVETRPLVVETCRPGPGTVQEYVAEDGKTRLDEEYVITMPINGRVRRIELDEGDRVTSGQMVASIDDFALRREIEKLGAKIEETKSWIEGVDKAKPKREEIEAARLNVARAQLALETCRRETSVTQINLAEAEREFRRMKNLLADGVVQQAQYDEAKRAYDTSRERLDTCGLAEETSSRALEIARLDYDRIQRSVDDNEYQRGVYQAQINQIKAQIALLRDDLSKTEIRAPVGGVVLEKYLEDEQVLMAGAPLLKIADMESIEIEADILSEEVTGLEPGQSVGITGKALGGRTAEGRLKRIYPGGFKKISALGIEQQRVKVIVGFDNRDLGLRPYVSVDLRIIVDEHKGVLTVPEQAVFKSSDTWSVLVIEDSRLALREIEIGLRNDEVAEIVRGLTEDDLVVAEPTNDLQPGQRARPAASP